MQTGFAALPGAIEQNFIW